MTLSVSFPAASPSRRDSAKSGRSLTAWHTGPEVAPGVRYPDLVKNASVRRDAGSYVVASAVASPTEFYFKYLKTLARPTGFEPVASAFGGQRSIQLSYGRIDGGMA